MTEPLLPEELVEKCGEFQHTLSDTPCIKEDPQVWWASKLFPERLAKFVMEQAAALRVQPPQASEQRDALQAWVDWDNEHEGMYSDHNPAVRKLKAASLAALRGAPTDSDWLRHHLHVNPSANCHLCLRRDK